MILLAPLDRSQVREMVAELSARQALPKEVVEGVTERTGGVPLFVEEVTRLLLERGEHGGIHAIPPTLQQSLAARLDRLGPARDVAQIGAVIGRDFSYPLLRAVAGMEQALLQVALERLTEADILLVQGVPPDADYRFKHALIQDAAYENLLKSRRQVLHRRIGESLRDNLAGTASAQPELLAHHFTQAGLTEAAIEWWAEAGQRSLERSALVEAIEQFTRALAQIGSLPATPTLRREEIKLQAALITPLIHVKGYAAPETKAAEERARRLIDQAEALGEPPEDPLILSSVLYASWAANLMAFNRDMARDLAADCLALAEKQGATVPLMIGHRMMGTTLFYAGDVVESRTHLDRVIALYDPAKHRALATRLGLDIGATVLSMRTRVLWTLGYPEAALVDAEQALKEARASGQAASLMNAMAVTLWTHVLCRNYETARVQCEELFALADQKGADQWKGPAILQRGVTLVLTGNPTDAVQTITSGRAAWQLTGSTQHLPAMSAYLARAHAETGHFDDAWRCIDEAMTAVEATKERWHQADIIRMAGEIALKSPTPDAAKAEAYFEQALTVARSQQAKSWELRAAMSMARLWRSQGKPQQARELLAPIYGWFTEGFDTLDLKQAKALLEELAS